MLTLKLNFFAFTILRSKKRLLTKHSELNSFTNMVAKIDINQFLGVAIAVYSCTLGLFKKNFFFSNLTHHPRKLSGW